MIRLAFKNPLKSWHPNSLKSGSVSSAASVFGIHPLVERLELSTENRFHRGNRRNQRLCGSIPKPVLRLGGRGFVWRSRPSERALFSSFSRRWINRLDHTGFLSHKHLGCARLRARCGRIMELV